jgi:hypothetical protein
MGYLAISIGDTKSVAVHRRDTTVDPTVFETTTDLSFAEDGTVSLGTEAQRDSGSGATTVAASISRVGRPPSEGDVYLAEDLVAHAVNCLVAMTASNHGGVTPSVAVVHPDSWGAAEVDLLLGAFDHTGLRGVNLVPQAAARGAFAALDSGAGLSDDVGLAIGALAVLEDGRSADAADTDALPVVAPPQALAFSEAIPVVVAEPASEVESDSIGRDRGCSRHVLGRRGSSAAADHRCAVPVHDVVAAHHPASRSCAVSYDRTRAGDHGGAARVAPAGCRRDRGPRAGSATCRRTSACRRAATGSGTPARHDNTVPAPSYGDSAAHSA